MSEAKIDFVGFTFNGRHSSEFGIVRTSDGSRFNENLLPTISVKTVQAPGADETYFFESNYTQQIFDIPFAFDALTEQQFQDLQGWFGDKKIHDLIFDERPYKIYKAKVTGSATIKHIPFTEGDTNRVYKGEGNIQLTAYNPFARSAFKFLDQATEEQLKNRQEWENAARMLETQGDFDILLDDSNLVKLYNPGNKESDCIIKFNFNDGVIPSGAISINNIDNLVLKLAFKEIKKQGDDTSVAFNSKLNLVEGYKDGIKTGNLYNQYVTAGDFFKIPKTTKTTTPVQLTIEGPVNNFSGIEYDYYYF